ncbi:two-component system sensor histidine kinase NtrB [Cohnella silvisoli]|uniref:histidine kinase n=1 Tax=Cohnella silvisoli TaxID=2873699 RepID=A0ABV1KRL9_9BACL|nr:ATP-binding protein [Cohnella silvisoli]MCD9022384.1 PAS domain-containing sensor histidine kinase [Cohnella silvisoli]
MDEPALLADDQPDYSIQTKQELYIRQFADRFLALEGTGVLILDSEFRIVEISEMICSVFGCYRTDILEKPVEEWFEQLSLHPQPFDRSLLKGITFRNRLLNWTHGKHSHELMLDGDVLQNDGGLNGAFVLFRDVSHMMTLEEQIRRSDRLKTIGQIAAGTAHEIRNPLTAIKGFMQLLNKTLTERNMSKEKEFVRIVLSELERVNDLVSEFLLLSKPKEIKQVSMRIGRVLQEILPMIRNEAMLYNVTVLYYPKPELNSIVADKELLKQVFLNLGKNAIEAMNGGGTLIIRECSHPDQLGKIAVEISDTGTGISADALEKVFDPFFTTKPQGTGLGLSVCQRIVHDLGGNIEVSSDEEGTRFTVWLPNAAGESEKEIQASGGERSSYDV